MIDLNSLHFPGKEPDEQIVMALRRHPAALAQKIFLFAFIGILPPIGFYLVNSFATSLNNSSSLGFLITVLSLSIFYLYILLFIYHVWVDYYLDLWIVTNERVVAMTQHGLFHREVSELRLNRIQDVSSLVKGLFPTFFKYGTVHVQTASEQDKFYFRQVPNPEYVARQILELHERYTGLDQKMSDSTHQNLSHRDNEDNL